MIRYDLDEVEAIIRAGRVDQDRVDATRRDDAATPGGDGVTPEIG